MKLNKEYKQLNLQNFTHNYGLLSGKVVKKISFNDRGYHDEQSLTIIFTDKTFISVGVRYCEDDSNEFEIANNWIIDPKCYAGGFTHDIWFDDEGKPHFRRWLQQLVDLGLWEVSEEEVAEEKERQEKEKEEREYNEYLRLKEKYEGKRSD